jgi:Leucine-rich repeat (LRR) protein
MKLRAVFALVVIAFVIAEGIFAQSKIGIQQSSKKNSNNDPQKIAERHESIENALLQNFSHIQSEINRDLGLTVQSTAAVVINDANLEQAVRDALGKPTGEITEADMAMLITLVANDENISDITGLEYAINLSMLSLRQNNISDLSPLQNLVSLTTLFLDNNYIISDIQPLANLTNLSYLGLSNNNVTDISSLQNAYDLISLTMNNNQVADISPLQNHFLLDYLLMGNNQVSDISALHNITSLTTLYLHGNQIQDISALSNLVNLLDLYIPSNQISDMSSIQSLTNLQSLSIHTNQISDLSAVQNLSSLAILVINDNQITDVNPLQNLINLNTLYLGNNGISDISSIAGLVNLGSLKLDGTLLDNDDLPLMYDLDALTGLDLRNNPGITSGTAMQTLGDNLDNMTCEDILWDGVCGEDPPVPVELSSFKAIEKNGNILLEWKTESEQNSFGFEIEKSRDRKLFNRIGFVAGKGTTTSPEMYTFLDENVSSGIYYFRLRQVDLDGQFEYSDIIEITINSPSEYKLNQNFPNPFNSKTMISFAIPEKAQVQIAVFDITGKTVMVLTNEVYEAGSYHVSFNASNLPSGSYYYKMTAGNFTHVQKLAIVK